MVELLAPAGEVNSGYAAFAYGADAVYLGLMQFSARAEAENFTPTVFSGFTRYAHSLGKKVLVAVNTVFFEEEKPQLIETLDLIRSGQADGVIVQDLGTARLIKNYFPTLRLHASTQLAVHNRQGVEALRDAGFRRVVLARELTLDEIKDICRVPGIEKEVFIHGALCYSYSGLCLFSSLYTGRSANRGKCVYPCRESFDIGGESKHIFSMKDLAQGENVRLLEQAGVDALKIEGRKKSPLYVAAVTDYYRSILDGEKDRKVLTEKRNRISCIFSRPTTELYLKERKKYDVIDTDIVGHRGLLLGKIEGFSMTNKNKFIRFKTAAEVGRYDGIQIDLQNVERPFGFSAEILRVKGKSVFKADAGSVVEIGLPDQAPYLPEGAAVYLSSSSEAKGAYPFQKPKEEDAFTGFVDVFVSVGEKQISAMAEGITAQAEGDFSPARSEQTAEKAIRDAFGKTGGTGLVLEKLEIENPEKRFVPLSVLNDVRRRLYEQVVPVAMQKSTEEHTREKQQILEREKTVEMDSPDTVSYSVKTDDLDFLQLLSPQDWDTLEEAVFEISDQTDIAQLKRLPVDKVRFALPTIARAAETKKLEQKVAELLAEGFKKFEIGNVWGLNVFKNRKVDVSFDWPLYVANSSAARAALDLGASFFVVSPETPVPETLFKAFPKTAIGLAGQDMPLFVSETCPYAAVGGQCEKCGGNREEKITSRYGTFLCVMKSCRHFLLGEKIRMKKNEFLSAGAQRLRFELMRRSVSPADRLAALHRMIQK